MPVSIDAAGNTLRMEGEGTTIGLSIGSNTEGFKREIRLCCCFKNFTFVV